MTSLTNCTVRKYLGGNGCIATFTVLSVEDRILIHPGRFLCPLSAPACFTFSTHSHLEGACNSLDCHCNGHVPTVVEAEEGCCDTLIFPSSKDKSTTASETVKLSAGAFF